MSTDQHEEQWRAVPGFEGRYEVSSLGRVKSLARTANSWCGGRTVSARLLKQKIGRGGYCEVSLSDGGRTYSYFTVHKLVMSVFGAAPKNGEVVDHINGDKIDNRIGNLRLTNKRGNAQNQRRAMSHNGTGYLGVCFEKQTGKYKAAIRPDGGTQSVTLGRFETPEEAHEVYLRAKREVHPACTI